VEAGSIISVVVGDVFQSAKEDGLWLEDATAHTTANYDADEVYTLG